MSTTKDDGNWAVASPDGNYTVDEPFFEFGDSGHKVILWPHVQNAADRTPLALDTVHPDVSTAYLVNEFGFQDIGGGIDRWFREYATIPAARRNLTGTEVFQFPGLPTTAVEPVRREMSAATFSGSAITATTTTAHGLEPGDTVFISIRFFRGASAAAGVIDSSFPTLCLAGTTGSTVVFSFFTRGFTPTFSTGFILEGLFPGREAFSIPVQTVTDYEYFLPGVTTGVSSFEDVQPEAPFEILNTLTGERGVALAGADANAYRASVLAGRYLTLSSKVERYKGNIFVRETKRVKAQ